VKTHGRTGPWFWNGWAILGCLVLVGIHARTSPAHPPVPMPPADPAIAFGVQGSLPKLYVMNADGSNKTSIHTLPRFTGWSGTPSWSPDGQSLAFAQYPGMPGRALFRIDVDLVNGVPQGTNLTMIADLTACGGSCGSTPEWSPLGNEIAFVPSSGPTILVVPSTGGAVAPIYSPPPGSGLGLFLAWSSDGSQLAFVEFNGAGRSIRVLDRGTGLVVNTFVTGQFNLISSLDWARLGSNRLAFSATTPSDPTERVHVLDLGTGLAAPIVAGEGAAWSPDNAKIAFVAGGKIKTVVVATGAVQTLATGSNGYPDWRRF